MEHKRIGGERLTSYVVVAVCASPTAATNILPRLERIWQAGLSRSNEIGPTLGVVVSLAVMVAASFKWRNNPDIGSRLTVVMVALACLMFNLGMAVETTGAWQAEKTSITAAAISRSKTLNEQIRIENAALSAIPAHITTSADAVEAAKKASEIATKNKDDECKIVGPVCRERIKDSTTASTALADAMRNHTLTEEKAKHTAALKAAQDELLKLGYVPRHADPTADRIAATIGLLFDIGDGEKAEASVSRWWPIVVAVFVEAAAIFGPWMLMGDHVGAPPVPTIDIRRMRDEDGDKSVKHADTAAQITDASAQGVPSEGLSQTDPDGVSQTVSQMGRKAVPKSRKSGTKAVKRAPRKVVPTLSQDVWDKETSSDNKVLPFKQPLSQDLGQTPGDMSQTDPDGVSQAVSQMVAEGKTVRQIAEATGLSKSEAGRQAKAARGAIGSS